MSWFKKAKKTVVGSENRIWLPRVCDGYPLDIDASSRFTRYTGTFSYVGSPQMNGKINTMLPLYDALRIRMAIAKYPMGPGTTTLPQFLQQQMVFPQLPKMGVS